ncbi:MAG: hypothetical protein HQM02_11400, partial [Magnetococcales bacterium]|nr:hypothetical protein [Magnetococcales bacterium]
RICHTLAMTRRHPLLTLYGRLAETRWPQEPIFTYFRACGQCEGLAWRLSDLDFCTLLQAAEELRERDMEGAEMIHALLAIPASQRPVGPWHSIPLSPAKIPKPLETKLLKELRSRIRQTFQDNQDETAARAFKRQMIDSLMQTEFGQRGPLVLSYLIDRALKSKLKSEKNTPSTPVSNPQLVMDLFLE